MRKIIEHDSEKSYLAKMDSLPDGEWVDRTYIEACRPVTEELIELLLDYERKEIISLFITMDRLLKREQ